MDDLFENATIADFKPVGTAQSEPEQSDPIQDDPVALVTEPVAADVPNLVTPVEEVTPVAEVTPEPTVTPEPVKTWQEQIKAVDKYAAMKEIGLDDFEIDLLKYRAETGDLTPYLEAKTVDYTKMADTDIMRRNILKQYSGLTTEELELFYDDEVVQKYKLSEEFDEAEQKKGLLKLKLDSNKLRQGWIADQVKFKAPERPVDNSQLTIENERAAIEAQRVQAEQSINNDAATKDLLKSKRLAIKSADGVINFEVNPEELVGSAIDQGKFWQKFQTNNQPDLAKFYKINAYATDPDKYEAALISYGKSLGRKQEFDEIKNPSKPDTAAAPEKTFSNELDGIANAFLTKGTRR